MRVCVVLVALAALAFPQQRAQRPKEASTGWVQLFNGKDLTNWVKVGNEKWTVEDGAIRGEAVTKEYGYLKTEKNYKDFELSLRFKCVGDGNSGVFFHTEFKPGTPNVSQGLQFEIAPQPGMHTGGIYGDGRAWIAWPAPENELVMKIGEWNDMHMIVEGNRYRARLNGVWVLDFTDPTPRSFDGAIALQLHSGGTGNMLFKDIFIRDLSRR